MLGGDARGWKMNPRKKKAPFRAISAEFFVSCEFRSRYPARRGGSREKRHFASRSLTQKGNERERSKIKKKIGVPCNLYSIKNTPAVFVKRSFGPGVSLFIAGFLWDHS
jgi:hypothetical protein